MEEEEEDQNDIPGEMHTQVIDDLEEPLYQEPQETETHGTIKPNPDFKPGFEAERMKKAMRGIGTDEKAIIKSLVSHDNNQRAEIEKKYKALYGQDLIDDLKEELGGHFEMAVLALLTPKYDLLVQALNDSFRLIGSDAQILTEILCSRSSADVFNLCWWYENNFNEKLEDAIESNLSGDFKNLMISLISSTRPDEDMPIDEEEVQEDAQRLHDAGIGLNMGTEESEFIRIFNNCSYAHLNRVMEEYEKLTGEHLEVSINSEFSGDVRDGLLAIVKRVMDPHGFFAERLNMSMRGAGTDDKTLIRIIVSRSEDDLELIKKRYSEMYGNSLASDIKEDTGGDYAKILVAIINNNESQA